MVIERPFPMTVYIVGAVIQEYPQVQEAIRKIVADEWGNEDTYEVDRFYDIGCAVTDALQSSIGYIDPAEPGDTPWQHLILMNMIFHISDRDLGQYCAERFATEAVKEEP